MLQIRCEAGGLASCDAVAVRPTFPGATRWCCDVVAQDCGAGQRCNLVSTQPNDSTAISACIPAGTLTRGATCMREGGRLELSQRIPQASTQFKAIGMGVFELLHDRQGVSRQVHRVVQLVTHARQHVHPFVIVTAAELRRERPPFGTR